MKRQYKFYPPQYARENAKKSLEAIRKGSKAMTPVGRARARQLAMGEALDEEDLKQISAFRRHMKNSSYSKDYSKDKGAVAWLGWGNSLSKGKGKSDFSNWAERKLKGLK